MTDYHQDEHICKTQIKYMINFLSLFNDCSCLISVDDKAKIKVGPPSVSRYVHSSKYFLSKDSPQTKDHDYPIAERFLITPSGFNFS